MSLRKEAYSNEIGARILEKVDHDEANDLRDGFIVSLIGIAFIMLLMLGIFVCASRSQNRRRWCFCFRRRVSVSNTRSVPQIPRISSSSRRSAKPKTGLAGLTIKERHAVLEHLFTGNAYAKGTQRLHDVENPQIEATTPSASDIVSTETPETTTQSSERMQSPAGCDQSTQEGSMEFSNGHTDEEEEEEYVSDDDDATCAICLMDYEDGEMVLNGRSCRHRFHQDCVMEWLDKHDHCPFCRKEMMTSTEFREAAIAMLGQERITELGIDKGDDDEEAQTEETEGISIAPDASSNTESDNAIPVSESRTPPNSRLYDY